MLPFGKIAVTGGSGGAGQYVIRNLLEHGYEVVNLDRVPPSEDSAPCIETDLTDYRATEAAMQGCDGAVHLAANPHLDSNFEESADRFHNNTRSTFNVFNAAAAHGIKRVVLTSSVAAIAYGHTDKLRTFTEADWSNWDGNIHAYQKSKTLAEKAAWEFVEQLPEDQHLELAVINPGFDWLSWLLILKISMWLVSMQCVLTVLKKLSISLHL